MRKADLADEHNIGSLLLWTAPYKAGTFSLLSALVNAILFWFDINRTSHHFCIEFCLILVDIFSIISLFYGIWHMRPNFLKPYLAWCVALIILFVLSLAELINGGELSVNITILVVDIFNVTQSISVLLTIISLIGLLASIAFNIWFLCVIFEYYQWLITEIRKPLHLNNDHILASQLLSPLES
uniref:MARVEL domain-containing protein n=1 Tax=Elaeophora elaphi TaxID=1147741 RepID=A0A0R3S4F8_9BILA